MKSNLFREKAIKKITSPVQINEYIRTSNPSIWIIFSAVILLLIGALLWALLGKVDISVSSVTVSENGTSYCYISENDIDHINSDTYAEIEDKKYKLENISKLPVPATDKISKYGLHLGNFNDDDWVYIAQIKSDINEGIYKTKIIIDSVSPISLLLN